MTLKQQEREYTELYSDTIDSLEEAYQSGQISEKEFISLKTQTLAELEEALAELRGLTPENLEQNNQEQNYSMYNNYANFSTASTYLVPEVIGLIDRHYEDREDAFADIMEVTGIDEDELEGFLAGDLEASPEFIDMLNGMFEETATDPEVALGLQVMGALDRGDTSEDELTEAYYEEGEEVDPDDEDEDYEDDEGIDAEAVYSYIDPRVQELESKMADFELNNDLKVRLSNVADYARRGVEERWLTKAQHDLLIGSFNKDEDRVAAFSQTAEANNVDLSTQLYAVLFSLKAAEKCGDPRINFGSMVNESNFSKNDEESELAAYQIQKMIEQKQLFSKVRR